MEGAKQPSIDACSSTCLVSRTCVADRIQANSEAGRPVARSPVRLSPFYFSNPSRDGPCAREKHSSRSIERIVTATRQGSTRKYRHIKKKRDSLSASSSSSAPPPSSFIRNFRHNLLVKCRQKNRSIGVARPLVVAVVAMRTRKCNPS